MCAPFSIPFVFSDCCCALYYPVLAIFCGRQARWKGGTQATHTSYTLTKTARSFWPTINDPYACSTTTRKEHRKTHTRAHVLREEGTINLPSPLTTNHYPRVTSPSVSPLHHLLFNCSPTTVVFHPPAVRFLLPIFAREWLEKKQTKPNAPPQHSTYKSIPRSPPFSPPCADPLRPSLPRPHNTKHEERQRSTLRRAGRPTRRSCT